MHWIVYYQTYFLWFIPWEKWYLSACGKLTTNERWACHFSNPSIAEQRADHYAGYYGIARDRVRFLRIRPHWMYWGTAMAIYYNDEVRTEIDEAYPSLEGLELLT